MIPSRFNIAVADFPGPGKHILYNTRSQAQVVIDNDLRTALAGLPSVPDRAETSQAFAQLQKMGFIVAAPGDDDAAIERFFARIRDDAAVLRPTILTTFACNFRCVYCVEEGLAHGAPMSTAAAETAAAYVVEQFRRFGSKQIRMNFYGGEPLLNLPAIRTVAGRIKAFTDAEGVPFSFDLSTNGALLTRETTRELKALGLAGAKITLDGPRETHDAYRPFRSGAGTYDLLLGNIGTTADLIAIRVEINFDQGNVDRVGELLDDLTAAGLAARVERLLFNPIVTAPKERDLLRPGAEYPCAFMGMDTARRLVALKRLAVGRGFPVDVGVEAHVCELLTKRTNFIIDPTGALSRCGGLGGRPEFSFGSIRGPEEDRYMGRETWRRCASCALAPQCGDGCPLSSYVRHGDPLALDCEKDAMEYLVREGLKLAYEVKRAGRPA